MVNVGVGGIGDTGSFGGDFYRHVLGYCFINFVILAKYDMRIQTRFRCIEKLP